MAATMSSTQNRSWTRSCPARASMSASGWSVSRRTMAAASAPASCGGTSRPVTPSLDHLRDAADVRTRRPAGDSAIASRIDQPLRLAVGRQHGHVERGGHRRHVVAPAGEDDCPRSAASADELARRPAPSSALAPAPLADDQEVRVGHGAQHQRPRLEQRRVALLGLEPGDDARRSGEPGSEPVLLGQRAARLLVVVALEVDAVVDQLTGTVRAPLVARACARSPG